ncbi:cobalt ECF transporter T component CbiQ [Pelovirga terrestris]|nr:cobalt ECF transporter T component CbiQ [Pelovirga terrestris]
MAARAAMRIERFSHQSAWRHVAPSAKGIFTLSGLCAAFLAASVAAAAGVALTFAFLTLAVARIAWRSYLLILAPALFFLVLSAFSIALSITWGESWRDVSLSFPAEQLKQATLVCTRSLACLCSLLFLPLTTPLGDLMALLRRLRTPELLIDIMVLGYRSLFVFAQVVSATRTAQIARLGYINTQRALRSLGILIAHTTLHLWQRAEQLHAAAQARSGEGPLRFADQTFPHAGRDGLIALLAGASLNIVVVIAG